MASKLPKQVTAWGLHSIGLLLISTINDLCRGLGGLSLLCSLKQELSGQIPNPNSQICDSWGKSGQLIFYEATVTGVQVCFILTDAFHCDSCSQYGENLSEALPSE